MIIGQKIHRSWIKNNGIRNSSECAVEQIEIAIQRTFLCRILFVIGFSCGFIFTVL